ncbi:gastrula zinc finger protein XlCGF57.1 [Anabrus simplex]|uniref:gastrula zinc finger protein XlCGF57.1 n=1 Tax=Anabrus simplex TaxID=316456 RepID=UPI0035A3B06A
MEEPQFIKCEPTADSEESSNFEPNVEFQAEETVNVKVEPDITFVNLKAEDECTEFDGVHDIHEIQGEKEDVGNGDYDASSVLSNEMLPSTFHDNIHNESVTFGIDAGETKDASSSFEPGILNSKAAKRGHLICTICSRGFNRPSNLNAHMLTHSAEKPYSCSICCKGFTRPGRLTAHMLTHTNDLETLQATKPYPCTVCHKRFPHPCHLKKHMLSHTGERPYACTRCNRRFALSGNLKAHMLIHSGVRRHACTICGKAFVRKTHYNEHLLIHTSVKYPCKTCGKLFVRREDTDKNTSPDDEESSKSCPACRKVIVLFQPQISTSPEFVAKKPFICKTCNEEFNSQEDLKEHSTTHTETRTFCCSVCNMSFSTRSILYMHMIVHSDDKPFQCKTCNKSFARRGDLKKHIFTHSGLRPYTCTLCNKTFARRWDLKKHAILHAMENQDLDVKPTEFINVGEAEQL